jgi:hypothetical protein
VQSDQSGRIFHHLHRRHAHPGARLAAGEGSARADPRQPGPRERPRRFVSTGYSSIQIDLSYDFKHRRFNEAITKLMGSGMKPDEIIEAAQTAEGPVGIRYNAHVAFGTA